MESIWDAFCQCYEAYITYNKEKLDEEYCSIRSRFNDPNIPIAIVGRQAAISYSLVSVIECLPSMLNPTGCLPSSPGACYSALSIDFLFQQINLLSNVKEHFTNQKIIDPSHIQFLTKKRPMSDFLAYKSTPSPKPEKGIIFFPKADVVQLQYFSDETYTFPWTRQSKKVSTVYSLSSFNAPLDPTMKTVEILKNIYLRELHWGVHLAALLSNYHPEFVPNGYTLPFNSWEVFTDEIESEYSLTDIWMQIPYPMYRITLLHGILQNPFFLRSRCVGISEKIYLCSEIQKRFPPSDFKVPKWPTPNLSIELTSAIEISDDTLDKVLRESLEKFFPDSYHNARMDFIKDALPWINMACIIGVFRAGYLYHKFSPVGSADPSKIWENPAFLDPFLMDVCGFLCNSIGYQLLGDNASEGDYLYRNSKPASQLADSLLSGWPFVLINGSEYLSKLKEDTTVSRPRTERIRIFSEAQKKFFVAGNPLLSVQ